MSGWGLPGILNVRVPNNVDSFAPLQLKFWVAYSWKVVTPVGLIMLTIAAPSSIIHSHIIGCGSLIEFFKAMQEVWLWSRYQVTIFENRWRITVILMWKKLIEVAISILTSDVKSREKLTCLLEYCYLHVWCVVRFRWLGEDCELVFLYYFIDTCFLLF